MTALRWIWVAVVIALATCERPLAPAEDLTITAPADMAITPRHELTPGAVATTDAGQVCAPGYARAHRRVSAALRDSKGTR